MKRLTAKKQLVLEFIFCSLPLIYYLLCLPGMPETVPVHWNAGGTADRFAPRFSFDMLLISAAGYVGLLIGVGLRKLICSISTQEREENRAHHALDGGRRVPSVHRYRAAWSHPHLLR